MRVSRRALAGGDPLLAIVSLAGMTLSVMVGFIGRHWGWPLALIGGLLFLLVGLRHKVMWQCRRCRSTFRRLEGEGETSARRHAASPTPPIPSERSHA